MAKFMALWHRALVIAFCITLLVLWNAGDRLTARQLLAIDNSASSRQANPPCRSLPGAEDTLVVLKTGSTELKDRLPVHLSTTLQCYPHYMIFSDFEESFESEHIIDALEFVSPEILNDHDDFELWRRLQQGGRSVLESSELSGPDSEAIESIGKSKNPGWKLDKWKFLPMMNRTFHDHPDMKWYVFAEADTYLLWASLLEYLAVLDHTKPHYSGSQMFIGDTLFAHGGSGFVVSQPAMRLVVDRFEIHQREIESYTDNHWAGDCVLGKVFNDAGVQFTNAWPIMQGDYPGIVAYARPDGRPIADPNMRQWCYPVVSYHHMTPDEIEDMWHFEQGWLALNRTVRLLLASDCQDLVANHSLSE